jgi:hypothetical protein
MHQQQRRPSTLMNSDFLILVLYDFIVQNILSSLLLLCYNLMIMNDYALIGFGPKQAITTQSEMNSLHV